MATPMTWRTLRAQLDTLPDRLLDEPVIVEIQEDFSGTTSVYPLGWFRNPCADGERVLCHSLDNEEYRLEMNDPDALEEDGLRVLRPLPNGALVLHAEPEEDDDNAEWLAALPPTPALTWEPRPEVLAEGFTPFDIGEDEPHYYTSDRLPDGWIMCVHPPWPRQIKQGWQVTIYDKARLIAHNAGSVLLDSLDRLPVWLACNPNVGPK